MSELGASVIGLVSAMPSGPGVITEDAISEIVKRLSAPIETSLLTSETTTEKISNQIKRTGVDSVQLVDAVLPKVHIELAEEFPTVTRVQVIHVLNQSSVTEAIEVAPYCDRILLDSGNPNLQTKQLGGTGRTHDWQFSAEIVRHIKKPVFLAGGLNAKNVASAIAQVAPFGVDICSGVRTDGRLDRSKLQEFIARIRSD